MKATIVFQKNWESIHLKAYFVKKEGDKFIFYNQDADGSLVEHSKNKVNLSKYELHEYPTTSFLVDINNLKEFGSEILYRRYRYIIDTGSSRSSKTGSLIQCCDAYARSEADKRITVWRDTKKDCKDTVLNDIIRYFKMWGTYKKGQTYHITESIFTYFSGSTFEIHGTDDEEKVMGLNKAVTWLNEPYKISKETFNQLDQRTDDFVLIDWNPKKSHWIENLTKDPRAIVIHSTFKDNPFCPPEQRLKILSYQPIKLCELVEIKALQEEDAKNYDLLLNPNKYTEKQIRELARCRENESKGSANAFNWQVYGLGVKSEKPNRIFNWTEISIEKYKAIDAKVYNGVDWGAVDPWGIVEVKYYDGGIYLKELNYASENEIRSRLSITELTQINGETEGIVTWLFTKLGINKSNIIVCDTNRPDKISALRRSGWQAYPARNKAILDGIDLMQNLKIYYTSCSENIKYEQENYSRSTDKTGYILEEPEDTNNHTIDPIRYICLYLQSEGIIKRI